MNNNQPARKLRVAQWATGTVGSSALRAVLEHPSMELVGVRVYSPAKEGIDAGELCGLPATGVLACQDMEAILALKPDCVVYMPDRTDVDEVCTLLARGVNVVTTRAEFFNPAAMDTSLRERVESACREGNSSIHSSGSSPGFITEALLPPLLSLQRRLDLLTIDEFANCVDTCSEDMLLNIMGFGKAPDVFSALQFTERDTVFGHSLGVIASAIGLEFDEVSVDSEFAVTRQPVLLHTTTIAAGSVGGQRHTVTGLHQGRPVLRFRSNWFVSTDLEADWVLREDGWRVLVEGDAPLDITITFPISQDPLTRAAIMPNFTAHRPVNAIPSVCFARHGIVTSAELPQIFPWLGSVLHVK
ncbi:dihydrodipicolinate reductase [Aestuariicella hydrocarbonica]|uniref:Dihydrodipicolinate reductase n=1 Tax=Pseudomaricurvus hydrocarbonicus TaxID=1470433 RepID=A0A9E5T1A2_9GAMM|nr:dihydrodipicolinate reductase [Aestuariicella hydrocarbonica]NHO67110.1 dihydrodipicolinate reductase [Aestuariicella hydrocarbonica]